jgi:hypothetical protein
MIRWLCLCSAVFVCGLFSNSLRAAELPLRVGFAEVDITPKVGGDRVVYLAGVGQDRKATAVHDPIMARAVVLLHDKQKVALVALDLVGFFRENVLAVRKELPGFDYVLVNSTHNHEGPDTLGLWGKSPFSSGVDKEYLKSVEDEAVRAVRRREGREGGDGEHRDDPCSRIARGLTPAGDQAR